MSVALAVAAVSGFRLLTEPVTMATVISLVCGCLVALVLVVALLLYAFKKERWCFSREYAGPSGWDGEGTDDHDERVEHSHYMTAMTGKKNANVLPRYH